MRSSIINIRQEEMSTIATKNIKTNDNLINSKLAIETLMRLYRSYEESDCMRKVIVGLLLKVKGFNNYKAIVKDIHPDYLS